MSNINRQNHRNIKAAQRDLSTQTISALISSLVIISIFPIYITFALEEWPLQLSVLILDTVYLLVVAGYILVLTGRNRSKWLVATISVIGIIGVLVMGWLILTLGSFTMSR